MTMLEIKSKLPNVLITIDGKIVTGRVSGRLNKFASVSEFGKLGSIFHFSWEAIERAINHNTPLKT